MAVFKVHKTTTVPATYAGHEIYFVAPSGKPNYVEIYVSNAAGNALRRVITDQDVQDMINAAISGGVTIVDNISARNALTPYNGMQVLVLDASADPTVSSGAATYIYRSATSSWIKISEAESMDVILDWSNIQNRPTSSVSAIDAAVANSHTHSNMTQLGYIGQDGNGDFTYNGNPPRARLETTGW
jgi:hypothetical protein